VTERAVVDYCGAGGGWKQSMLVVIRKLLADVCRSAWKMSIG